MGTEKFTLNVLRRVYVQSMWVSVSDCCSQRGVCAKYMQVEKLGIVRREVCITQTRHSSRLLNNLLCLPASHRGNRTKRDTRLNEAKNRLSPSGPNDTVLSSK